MPGPPDRILFFVAPPVKFFVFRVTPQSDFGLVGPPLSWFFSVLVRPQVQVFSSCLGQPPRSSLVLSGQPQSRFFLLVLGQGPQSVLSPVWSAPIPVLVLSGQPQSVLVCLVSPVSISLSGQLSLY